MYVTIYVLAFLASYVTTAETDYCLAEDDQPYLFFSSKSAYHFVHGKNAVHDFQTVKDCTPVQIFMISRHGTRYPKLKVLDKMKTLPKLRDRIVYNHENQNRGYLCDADLENLRNWKLDKHLKKDMANFLTSQGIRDLKNLGNRLKTAFPDFLEITDDSNINTNFLLGCSNTQRTKASMKAFVKGLFSDKIDFTPTDAYVNETLLHAYKYCDAWKKSSKSEENLREYIKFKNGPEMQELLFNVSRRLGFTENLTFDSVNNIYEMCKYDKAWKVENVSPWCAAFSKEELRVIEYGEDLNYYYFSGPGRDINTKIGCPMIKELFEQFQKLEGDDYSGEPKGVFYFTHSVNLQSLITVLGIEKDPVPLLASNYKNMGNRQWRTSLLDSFASNLIAVFYKCNDSDHSNKVMFHWSEKLVSFEDCEGGLCDWETIKNKLGKQALECNMDFCNREE